MIGTLRYNAEDGRRQMILVVPFMSPLAHSSHRAQQAGLHAYICDVLSPSVHLLYSPACVYTSHMYGFGSCSQRKAARLSTARLPQSGTRNLSCTVVFYPIHSRFLQGLPPHAINLLHSCDTVRPGPMQCRNHAALAAFCFLYAC